MLNENIWCVIMAGGSGIRFWPVSTSKVPKQFIKAVGEDDNYLQITFRRFEKMVPPERILVVTNKKYRKQVEECLPELPVRNILCEPYARDTAICMAYAMYTVLQRDPEGMMIVSPSDHIIPDEEKFQSVVTKAVDYARENDVLMTIGVKPTRPDTNYGYIQADGEPHTDCPIKVKTFTEKPDASLAEVFVQSGDFMWNSGIYIWKADTIHRELQIYMPQLTSAFKGWQNVMGTPLEEGFIESNYSDAQKISIDYAIMEKTYKAWTYPADFAWYDIGTWESLYSYYPVRDDNNNAFNVADLLARDSRKNLVFSSYGKDKEKLFAICGLENFVVVDTENVLLVCPRDDKKLREFVLHLTKPGLEKYR